LGETSDACLEPLVDHLQSVKYKSTTIKTSWPGRKATSSKDRWIVDYSIGLTIMGKLDCPNYNNKKKEMYQFAPQKFELVSRKIPSCLQYSFKGKTRSNLRFNCKLQVQKVLWVPAVSCSWCFTSMRLSFSSSYR
jgi:hypothetical protein